MKKLYFNLIISFFIPIFACAILQIGIARAQDTVSPYLVSVSSDGATFETPGTETITLTFSEDVIKTWVGGHILVDGVSQTLNEAGPADIYTFDFPVAAGDLDLKVITVCNLEDAAVNLMTQDSSHTFLVDTAADGDLDKTFAQPGIFTYDSRIFTASWGGVDAVLQPNGKVVAVGSIMPSGANWNDTAVFRFNADGSLDPSFGPGGSDGDGVASIDTTSGNNDGAQAVALQSDGKIVVGGTTFDTNYFDFLISRFDENGNLDTSFGTNGKTQITFDANESDRVWDLAIDSGGTENILAVGNNDGSDNFAIALLNSSGGLVSTFDGDGKLEVDFVGGYDFAYAGGFDSNGDIVVAGFAYEGSDKYFALAKMDQTGALDADFGTTGKLKTSILGEIKDIKIVGTDIYVFGKSGGKLTFAKFDGNGNLDAGFGTSGITQTTVSGTPSKIEIDADGKIWGAGVLGGGKFIAMRLNADGSLDTDFGTDIGGDNPGGKVAIEETYADAYVHPVGFVVKSGASPAAVFVGRKDHDNYSLAGLKNSGVIDTSISQIRIGNGKLIIEGFKIQSVARKSNGKIVAAGYQRFEDEYNPQIIFEQRIALLQMNADGTADCDFGDSVLAFEDIYADDRKYGSTGFGFCGTKILDLPNDVEINSVSIDELNDKIVVAGEYKDTSPTRRSFVSKFNADGSLDTSFSAGDADGIDGVKIFDTSATADVNYLHDVKVLSDGKILVSGVAVNTLKGMTYYHFIYYYWTLTKLNADGTLDTSFGTEDFDGSNAAGITFDGIDGVSSLVVDLKNSAGNQGDDNGSDHPYKILVNDAETEITLAGYGWDDYGNWMAARFDASGTLDTTFGAGDGDGTDGVAIFQPSEISGDTGIIQDMAWDAALQPDGKIVFVGHAEADSTSWNLAVARLDADGILDTSFGANGVTITSFESAEASVAIQPDGKIVVADVYFQIVRFNANGSLDTSFGTGGVADHGANNLKDVLILPDGKILVVGTGSGVIARLANTVSSLPVTGVASILPAVYLLLLDE